MVRGDKSVDGIVGRRESVDSKQSADKFKKLLKLESKRISDEILEATDF
jgi:hypothetical protein